MTQQPTVTHCSIPLRDADLGLDNANWTKGLQAMSDWVWSANLNPDAFPNNLARYFLHIPAVFEHQLHFSTTLIFDEPSFRNGVQVSGFLDRPLRELVINYIGQLRRSKYTVTHHAILGTLTALKHGIDARQYSEKLVALLDHAVHETLFSPLEIAALGFAKCFATDPKTWTDEQCTELRRLLTKENERRHARIGRWMTQQNAALAAARAARGGNQTNDRVGEAARLAFDTAATELDPAENERRVNAQMVELAFVCLQFVALTDVFSALQIPDEDFLPSVMSALLSPELRARIDEVLDDEQAPHNFLPPRVELPVQQVSNGKIAVEPAALRGSRVPLVSYEVDPAQATRDKGLAVGGVQTGVWGWSFGSYFPGGLVYLLMHHPELARFEPPYSLPLLFNEDEWRNGTQTGGFVSRRLKEIAFLKVYSLNRARYGLEHHTMFLFNVYLDEYGVGRAPRTQLDDVAERSARTRALDHAERVVLYIDDPRAAPDGTYTHLEKAAIAWVEQIVSCPHAAQPVELPLREELARANSWEARHGLRRIDMAGGLGEAAAMERLVDHQVAELAMLTGHMDGLGRAMSILRLESESSTARAEGYFSDRPSLFQVYDDVGITPKVRTINELRLNPLLVEDLKSGQATSPVSGERAARTGEF